MKAFSSIFRNGFLRDRRPAGGSKRGRPTRSFAASFAALEGRALLSAIVGPVLVTAPTLTAATASLESLLTAITPPQNSAMPTHTSGQGFHGQGGGGGGGGGGGQAGSQGPGGVKGSGGLTTLAGVEGDHVSMDVVPVVVDGRSTPEFALADFDTSTIYVRLGNGPIAEIGPDQGVDHPDSVTLADITGDGFPDLIVANTNANNILVFPGLGRGQFGPELNDGQGFAVGEDPVSVTVNYVDGDPTQPQLIVANAESNSVSILTGQSSNGVWSVVSTASIANLGVPTKTLLDDVTGDGVPDLLVCDTGSDEVTVIRGMGAGEFDPGDPTTIKVGLDPEAMILGTFDRHSQSDLVTINTGSDDLTYIANVFGPNPTTSTIASGGTSPDAAFAVDPMHTGIMDLVVANGGDGHMAVFRGGDNGLQLAGVITQPNLPSPTALAPASSGGDELDFFAAGAGDDSALLLQFDLGVASTYLPGSSSESAAIGAGDADLIAQLMPFDGSSLDLIAVLWAGSSDVEGESAASSLLREPSALTVLYSPTEGQGGEEPGRLPGASVGEEAPPAKPVDPAKVDSSAWARVVSGVLDVLGRPTRVNEALAARDALDEDADRPLAIQGLVRLDLDAGHRESDRPLDADLEGAPGILGGGAIRLIGPEAAPDEAPTPEPTGPSLKPSADAAEPPSLEGGFNTVPLVSSALIVSARLIIRASPPRPPSHRGVSWLRRFVSLGHDRKTPVGPTP